MVRLIKEMFIIALGVLAVIYLLNPFAGIFEFIPDVVPIFGNIDEGFATMLLVAVLRHYGLDLSRFLGTERQQPTIIQSPKQSNNA